MRKFFILGMPRSRTYWLSKFLECLHEGIYYYPDYQKFMESGHIGDSTTCYPAIKNFIKGEKKIILHRNRKEVEASLVRVFGKTDLTVLDDMEKELKTETGLHINYDDISDRIIEIWNYCRNDFFPKERFKKMDGQILENQFMINEVKLCLG